MPRSTTVQTNFTSGEISPRLLGRIDLNRYANGAKRIQNMIVKPQGGLFRRTGSLHLCRTKFIADDNVVLVDFESSEGVTYVLEVGTGYIRFMKDRVVEELSPGVPYEIVSPYVGTEIQFLSFAQSIDELYIASPSYQPQVLTRLGSANWTLTEYITNDGPYLPENKSDITMKLSNVVDTAFLVSSAADFSVADVGKYVEFTHQGLPMIALVTANVSPTRNQVTPIQNILAPLDPKTILTYAPPNLTSSIAVFSSNNVGSYIKRAAGAWHLINTFTSTTQVVLTAAVTMVVTAGIISMVDRTITATCNSSADVFNALDVKRDIRFNFSGEQVWGKITGYTNARQVSLSLGRPVPQKKYDARDPSPGVNDAAEPPEFNEPDKLYPTGRGYYL